MSLIVFYVSSERGKSSHSDKQQADTNFLLQKSNKSATQSHLTLWYTYLLVYHYISLYTSQSLFIIFDTNIINNILQIRNLNLKY